MTQYQPQPLSPRDIFETIRHRVVGQDQAMREVSVALSKHLLGHAASNILLIGGSGSGKTTILRAMEELLRSDERLATHASVVRMNANLLAELAGRGEQSGAVLSRLAEESCARLGAAATPEKVKHAVEHGLVFVDEVDKIRSRIGDRANVTGIVAQESLLTLMEGETQEIRVAIGDGGPTPILVQTAGILFVAAGAFDELYDRIFERVTQHDKTKAYRLVPRPEGGVDRIMTFDIAKHLKHADLFEYGIAPQFLARFAGIVTLRNLSTADLVTIFRDMPDAPYRTAKAYFEALGVGLRISDEAVKYMAHQASREARLGARALREVFGTIMRDLEFDPWSSGLLQPTADGGFELVVDLENAKKAYQGRE